MSDSPVDAPTSRWEVLGREVRCMQDSLKEMPLAGVLDREANHIAAMQDEIDWKTREALALHWLGVEEGELPEGIG